MSVCHENLGMVEAQIRQRQSRSGFAPQLPMISFAQNLRLRIDLLLALLAGSVAAIVYYLGSAPGVLFGDGGELQFAAWTAGLPHPTGYPLYMTLGWAWSHLLDAAGLASPARAMTLLSVLFAALAVGLTYLLARTLIGLGLPQVPPVLQRLAALLAALTFAFTPTFWSQAVVTEVYTLHAAFVALILWLVLLWRVERGVGRVEGGEWRVESDSLGPVSDRAPSEPASGGLRPCPVCSTRPSARRPSPDLRPQPCPPSHDAPAGAVCARVSRLAGAGRLLALPQA